MGRPQQKGTAVMKWYWKVRIYNTEDNYWTCEIETEQNLDEILTICNFYLDMTSCKMLLEGMAATSYGISSLNDAFKGLWRSK
jgi:hypothetical protein